MDDWGKGYITDIEYNEWFQPPMAPQRLALTAVMNGFEPPGIDAGLAYCELGCARGLTSLVLAAVNPKAIFHAIDFNPSSIAHAKARARAAGLDNITFHERSFEGLTEPSAGLPMFDIVAMHGVWSWIAPELQRAIITFLKSHLKPGGLVYVSYNPLPAWNEMMPLQRVLRELATAQPGRSDQAVANALAMVNRLFEKKIIPPRFQDAINRLNEDTRLLGLIYMVHEYLHTGWSPYYFADVARAFGEAKLGYAGSAYLMENFLNIGLDEEQRTLLSGIAVPELRETLRDFCISNQFRQDVYVRGARAMPEAKRQSLLNELSFALVQPIPEFIEVVAPNGMKWRPHPVAYRRILEALEAGPRSVRELVSVARLQADHTVAAHELVATLLGSNLAYLWRGPNRDAEDAAARLNEVLADGPPANETTIAVPTLVRSLTLSPCEFAIYTTLRRGETPDAAALAARVLSGWREVGRRPIADGKPIENEMEALAALTKECATKIAQNVPIWRRLGMVS